MRHYLRDQFDLLIGICFEVVETLLVPPSVRSLYLVEYIVIEERKIIAKPPYSSSRLRLSTNLLLA